MNFPLLHIKLKTPVQAVIITVSIKSKCNKKQLIRGVTRTLIGMCLFLHSCSARRGHFILNSFSQFEKNPHFDIFVFFTILLTFRT